MSGLYLVTLPIGNSEDITRRAFSLLEKTRWIYCEDTRVFKDFCRRSGLDYSDKEIRSFHDHSSEGLVASIIEQAHEEDICFVSDAGSPLISDPAFPLVEKAIEAGVEIDSIGGVSAVITALELCGLPPTPFHFHGFLARDGGKIEQAFDLIDSQYGTHLFFEGVSRVEKTLKLMAKRFPENRMGVCRELTKDYQSVHRFKGSEINSILSSITLKGEFVLAVYNGNKSQSAVGGQVKELAQNILDNGAKPKVLAKLLAEITGENSKEIYSKLSKR